VLSAAAALGVERNRLSDNAVSFWIEMQTPKGMVTAWALLDSGGECNFVNQSWATKHLPKVPMSLRRVHALDGHEVSSYGKHRVLTRATDRRGLAREHAHTYEAVEMVGYDVILGYPWLFAVPCLMYWIKFAMT